MPCELSVFNVVIVTIAAHHGACKGQESVDQVVNEPVLNEYQNSCYRNNNDTRVLEVLDKFFVGRFFVIFPLKCGYGEVNT